MPIGPIVERVPTPPPAGPSLAEVGQRETAKSPTVQPADGPSPFARLVKGLGQEVQHGETAMRAAVGAARAGADLGPAELIALQAGVYRYSEAIDLASRLVDRATSGVKTVVQGQ